MLVFRVPFDTFYEVVYTLFGTCGAQTFYGSMPLARITI